MGLEAGSCGGLGAISGLVRLLVEKILYLVRITQSTIESIGVSNEKDSEEDGDSIPKCDVGGNSLNSRDTRRLGPDERGGSLIIGTRVRRCRCFLVDFRHIGIGIDLNQCKSLSAVQRAFARRAGERSTLCERLIRLDGFAEGRR